MTDKMLESSVTKSVDPDAILRPKDIETVLPVTANHLAQLRHLNRGPRYIKHGRLIAYRAGDVQDWLLSGLVDPAEQGAA